MLVAPDEIRRKKKIACIQNPGGVSTLLSNEQKVQEGDARDDDSSTGAGQKNKKEK